MPSDPRPDLDSDPLLQNLPDGGEGKLLDRRYELFEVLGAGGMGTVYRGRQRHLEREVAVKCLDPRLVQRDPKAVERFHREGRAAERIEHPNVVRVHDVAESEGLHYLVMEYVDGEDVRERVRRSGPLALGEALRIALDVARGLAAVHKAELVHRDLKPGNVLVSKAGVVKLADFGLAKGPEELGELTVTGSSMGTPRYMAPEQFGGAKHAGPRADVYALGATVYFLLTGRDGVEGDSFVEIMERVRSEPFPRLREARPDAPRELDELVARCTAQDPDRRPADAGAVVRELEGLLLGSTVAPPPDPGEAAVAAPAPGGAGRRSQRPTVLVLLALGTAAIAGVLELQESADRRRRSASPGAADGRSAREAGPEQEPEGDAAPAAAEDGGDDPTEEGTPPSTPLTAWNPWYPSRGFSLGAMDTQIARERARAAEPVGGPAPEARRMSLEELAALPPPEPPSPEPASPYPDGPFTADRASVESWAEVLREEPLPSVVTDEDARTRMLACGLPWRVRERSTGIVMHLVPAGEFLMGSPADEAGRSKEEYQHRVVITRPFYLAVEELTRGTWRDVLFREREWDPSWTRKDDFLPMTLARLEAVRFLSESEAGLRFPTEAEWEYACRAGTTGPYSSEPKQSELNGRPVLWWRYEANPWGFEDVHGGQSEWCWDYYGAEYYLDSPVVDPVGPARGPQYVCRDETYLTGLGARSARRSAVSALQEAGLRVARTP